MQKYEKYILLILYLLIASRICIFLRDILIAYYHEGGELTHFDKKIFEAIGFLLMSLVNIGCGVWLFIEAKRSDINKWLWSAFGLVFGVLGIAVYYLIDVHSEIKTGKT